MSKITAKQAHWSKHLQQANAFEGSLAQYAQTQNIPVQTLYRWRHYFKHLSLAKPKSQALFTKVVTSPVNKTWIQETGITLQQGDI